ncbi:16548_t:CDS:2, partial [Funneliformis caledonium]
MSFIFCQPSNTQFPDAIYAEPSLIAHKYVLKENEFDITSTHTINKNLTTQWSSENPRKRNIEELEAKTQVN